MNKDFLARAAELAAQIDPHMVRPNPRVGCVVVRDGKIIAEGAHEVFGGAHAEVNAIAPLAPLCKGSRSPAERGNEGVSGKLFDISNCEVYITLEPCDHFEGKKTPSCTDLLIQKKPKKIIVGALDPKFQGKNIEKLRKAGIEVEVRNCAECQMLNPFFEKFVRTGLPYVTLKLAQSLDGKVTSPHPQSLSHGGEREETRYISNELSRKKVHEMRAQYSAILTTTETVLADDPRLDCRLGEYPSPSPREIVQGTLASQEFHGVNSPPTGGGEVSSPDVIVVGKRKIPKTAKIFSPAPPSLLPQGERGAPFPSLDGRGIEGEGGQRKIHFFPTHDIEAVFRECGKMGIDSVMTECGAVMATELLQKNLVDEIQLFIAPEVFGTGKNAFVTAETFPRLPKNFQLLDVQDLEGDIWLTLKFRAELPIPL